MKEIFASANVGLIGLFFFLVFFCIVTFWTFRPSAKNKYKEIAKIPLLENELAEKNNE